MTLRPVAFLVDVDDTLLDNDRIRADFEEHLESTYGSERRDAYWTIQERRFAELGYRDYVGAVQEWWAIGGHGSTTPRLLRVPPRVPVRRPAVCRSARGPRAPAGCRTHVIVLTDGDAIFQPRKIARSGIRDVADDVLVYVHKEDELEDVERRHPAARYVLVDDKVRILSAVKRQWADRVTTVLPMQGQFANDPTIAAAHPAPDVTVGRHRRSARRRPGGVGPWIGITRSGSPPRPLPRLVEDGMRVGLGTGSTVAHLLPALARRELTLRCVATSPATEQAARELGLAVEPFTGRRRARRARHRDRRRRPGRALRAGW